MKNILGTTEGLKLKDENGVLRYRYNRDAQYTYDSNGNELTSENSIGFWRKSTYDSNGNRLTVEDSDGFWRKSTYDSNGNELTSEDSDGYWRKSTYDSSGNKLTFEDSYGTKRVFDTKEYTMEELTKELGHNFKIKK
jgi:YD repeat-containing protein